MTLSEPFTLINFLISSFNCSLFRPINITNLCKLCTSMNSVSITWTVEVGKSHAVSIYLVENVTPDDLLNRFNAHLSCRIFIEWKNIRMEPRSCLWLQLSNPYIFEIWCLRPVNSVRSNCYVFNLKNLHHQVATI